MSHQFIPCTVCGKSLWDQIHEYSETADHIYQPDKEASREENRRIWGTGR